VQALDLGCRSDDHDQVDVAGSVIIFQKPVSVACDAKAIRVALQASHQVPQTLTHAQIPAAVDSV